MDYLKIKELYHHGIEGQKWGVRNGPPYPLDEGDYSKKELAAAKKTRKQIKRLTNKGIRNSMKKNWRAAHLATFWLTPLGFGTAIEGAVYRKVNEKKVNFLLGEVGNMSLDDARSILGDKTKRNSFKNDVTTFMLNEQNRLGDGPRKTSSYDDKYKKANR